MTNLWNRLAARRRRNAHQRYLRERARQDALNAHDVQQSVRDAANGSGAAQQAFYGRQ
jgi:hypothetical protein